ncbi:hypothetical protein FH972_022459 [Carpinus fangiana]|uniref:Major facilitator superfamily (MFS) profile domain-containing protein n=1 Tax=Carpinus fangiana TaxID=176857 RepID=A0A5N6KSV3_9ROSI|nr:hypothetical protein FH972_022459 [Carpinus fangiana]
MASDPPNGALELGEKTGEIQIGKGSCSLHNHHTQLPAILPPLSKGRQIALVFVLSGASFINTVSHMSALILLPTIGKDLHIPQERQQWVVESYALTFACFLFLWGRLADVYGRRWIFLLGSCWIILFCLVSPWSPNEITFDIFRGLQGLGAAANVPTAMGIIGSTFAPGSAKNYAISLFSAGFPLGSVVGNIIGGVIGAYAGWKWVYWVIAIITALITLVGYFVIPKVPPPSPDASTKYVVDWFGGVLITGALMMFMFGMTEGNVVGWSTPYIPVLLVLGILVAVGFTFWELHLEKTGMIRPLMKISLWNNKTFVAAQLINFFFFAAFTSYLVYATFFYQTYLGLSVIQTALRFLPTGVVGLLAVTLISQLIARVDGFHIATWGCVSTGIACLLFAIPIPTSTTYWAYGFPAMCLSALGVDTVYPLVALFTIQSVPQEDQAMGGSIVSAVGQLGRAIGLAISTATQVSVESNAQDEMPHVAQLKGYRAAEWLSFAFCMFSVIIGAYAFRGAGKVGAK